MVAWKSLNEAGSTPSLHQKKEADHQSGEAEADHTEKEEAEADHTEK